MSKQSQGLCSEVLKSQKQKKGTTEQSSGESEHLSSVKPNFFALGDVFGTRVFIENKGQFENIENVKGKIYYALDNGYEKVFFTSR